MQNAKTATYERPPSPREGAGLASRSVLVRLADCIDRLCEWAVYAACACLALLVLVLSIEIVARAFSSESPFSTWEYAGYLQAALVMLGAGYALRSGGHIRVNLVLAHLGKTSSRAFDILCSLVGLAVMAFICWALFDLFWNSVQSGRRSYFVSATPLWIPQVVLVLGSLLLALQFAARILKVLLGLPAEYEYEGVAGFGAE